MTAQDLEPFVTSGMAAITSACIIHPIDFAKTRQQLFRAANPGQSVPGFPKLLADVVKAEGPAGMYAGLGSSILRQATYGTARIGLYQYFADTLKKRNGGNEIPFYERIAAGLTGGALAVFVGNPFDCAMVRMQADSMKPVAERRGYRNAFHALAKIAGDEGFGTLYKGLSPNIARGMLMTAGQMATYDQAREFFTKLYGDKDGVLSMPTRLSSSFCAAVACAYASLPADLLKARLQDMKPDPKTGLMPYKNMIDCLTQIIKHEGPLALWTGHTTYAMRCIPHASIILLVREPIIQGYRKTFGYTKEVTK